MTDRYKFHNLVDQNVNLKIRLKTEQNIDDAINNLTTLIHSAAGLSNTTSNTKFSPHKQSFLSEQVRSLIVEKRRARAHGFLLIKVYIID